MSHITVQILILFLVGLYVAPSVYAAGHGGQIVEKAGINYEIVTDPEHREMKVYATGLPQPAPKGLALRIKSKDGFSEPIKLRLIENDPASAYYKGDFPASVLVSGGAVFDVNF